VKAGQTDACCDVIDVDDNNNEVLIVMRFGFWFYSRECCCLGEKGDSYINSVDASCSIQSWVEVIYTPRLCKAEGDHLLCLRP
jgi:hypothetical protein